MMLLHYISDGSYPDLPAGLLSIYSPRDRMMNNDEYTTAINTYVGLDRHATDTDIGLSRASA